MTSYSETDARSDLPVALEDPRGARRHEDVVPRNVDDRLGQQPISENQAENVGLLLVEEKRAVQTLDAEEVPAPRAAERARRQGRRKSRQRMLVSGFQVAAVPWKKCALALQDVLVMSHNAD